MGTDDDHSEPSTVIRAQTGETMGFTPRAMPEQNKDQQNLKKCIDELQKPILLGNIVSATVNGLTEVAHKLGRQPTGWFVVDKTSGGDVVRVAWDKYTVTFTSVTSVACSIYFF